MDPALCELLRSGANSEEVEAIIRVQRPHVDVTGVRLVARFGPVATCRLRRETILRTWRDDNVVSLKAARSLGPEPLWESDGVGNYPLRAVDGDRRRPLDVALTGAGIVVGVVDWGCDFDHPNFKHGDGSTRLLGMWDQRGPANDACPQPYAYGSFYSSTQIDAALRSSEPYAALNYHPASADRDGRGAHGTHVMDIAAGNGQAGGPVGVAPRADLVFVHLAERGTRGLANLGDSARILEAVDFITRMARGQPWVINLSVGRCGGPHDGSTLVELALDYAARAAPGRFIVQSAGNYFDRSIHASGRLEPGATRTLTFVTDRADRTPNELEVWYPRRDELAVTLESPAGIRSPAVPLGHECDVVAGGDIVGRLYHRRGDPNNGDNHADVFLSPAAPAGAWNVALRAVRVNDGVFHAWLERDEACGPCQARFVPDDADRGATTGTIANGREPFVVGAYDAHSSTREVAPFSSAGPTRDDRPKPDCVAPGVEVLAARSAPQASARSPGLLTRRTGTSMAAPHVTGAVALCLEAAGRLLSSVEIRALLERSLKSAPPGSTHSTRLGGGYLDVDRLVADLDASTHRFVESPQPTFIDSEENNMSTFEPEHLRATALSLGADRLYRELAYRPDGSLAQLVSSAYTVVARPGDRPVEPPRPGDVLVRVALGVPGAGHLAVVAGDGSPIHGIFDRFGRLTPGQMLLRPANGTYDDGGDLPDRGGGDMIDFEELGTDASGEAEWCPVDDELDAGEQVALLTAPLNDSEWRLVEMWLNAGEVGTDALTGDAGRNASRVASAIFCARMIGTPDDGEEPLMCVDPSVTAADPRVIELTTHVVERGPIINWATVPESQRRVHVMNLLVATYAFPENGAAGLVGNLFAESAVLPNRIEGSAAATPMRAANFRGERTDFSAWDVMNRDRTVRRGPRRPGIGLAQWTSPDRRAGLFTHRHGAKPPGAPILFDIEAQVDYLVSELRTSYAAVNNVLTDPAVSVNDASDDVVYRFEIPGSILHNGARLPRAHPAVQQVFGRRRVLARAALSDYRAAHPPTATAPEATEASDDVFNRQCGFVAPAGGVVSEADLRTAVRDVTRNERLHWLDPAGTTTLHEGVVGQFGHLVRYWLGSVREIQPGTLTHVQTVATNGTVDYEPLLTAVGAAAIDAAAAAVRVQLLDGAPGAGTPPNLDALVDAALKSARRSRTGPAANRTAWSSAFVSDCIRRVAINLNLETDTGGGHQGRDVLLRVSGGHRVYVHEAHRRTSGPAQREGAYHACPPPGQSVGLGDIIVQDRHPSPDANVADVWRFARIPQILAGRRLHGDIVVDVTADHVVAIGGNVVNSVRRRRYPLNPDGTLIVAREQLYTQETNNAVLPTLPDVNPAPGLHLRSTARIFALLSPVASCFIVPSPLFGGPST